MLSFLCVWGYLGPEYVPIPGYAYDCHTQAGRRRGATKKKFFADEQEALKPKQPGLFDHLVPEK